MKRVLFLCCVCMVFLFFSNCKSGTLDQLTGNFSIETKEQIFEAKAMKASDPAIERNITININEALKSRGIGTVDFVSSFFIDAVYVSYNRDICEKLDTYETEITFPSEPVEIVKTSKATDGCNLAAQDPNGLLSLPLAIDNTSTNDQYKKLLATDWGPSIKKGGKITVKLKMKAAQDYDKAVGASVSIKAHGKLGL